MSFYSCNICHKFFKTTQHLHQHMNRKKPCSKKDDIDTSNEEDSNEDNIISSNNEQSISCMVKFIENYKLLLNSYKKYRFIVSEKEKKIKELELENSELKFKVASNEDYINYLKGIKEFDKHLEIEDTHLNDKMDINPYSIYNEIKEFDLLENNHNICNLYDSYSSDDKEKIKKSEKLEKKGKNNSIDFIKGCSPLKKKVKTTT
jgi:hypothetical protein